MPEHVEAADHDEVMLTALTKLAVWRLLFMRGTHSNDIAAPNISEAAA
jgi:hypothetical protein